MLKSWVGWCMTFDFRAGLSGLRILDLGLGWWWLLHEMMIDTAGAGKRRAHWGELLASFLMGIYIQKVYRCNCCQGGSIVMYLLMMDLYYNWQTWTINWEGIEYCEKYKRMTDKRSWFYNRILDNFVCFFWHIEISRIVHFETFLMNDKLSYFSVKL